MSKRLNPNEWQLAALHRKQVRRDVRNPVVCRFCTLRIVIVNGARDIDGGARVVVCDAPDRKQGNDVWVDLEAGEAWVPMVPTGAPTQVVRLAKHRCHQ